MKVCVFSLVCIEQSISLFVLLILLCIFNYVCSVMSSPFVVRPDGKWLVEPVVGREELVIADCDHAKVRQERQNFDMSGHYSRPDVFNLLSTASVTWPRNLSDGQLRSRCR